MSCTGVQAEWLNKAIMSLWPILGKNFSELVAKTMNGQLNDSVLRTLFIKNINFICDLGADARYPTSGT